MFSEEIVLEIDKTLDQLIRNAEVISGVDLTELAENELEAFQKTQESLLQHFIHMDQKLGKQIKEKRQVQEKLARFEKLKSRYSKHIDDTLTNRPIICKRRAKRFFDLRFRKAALVSR